MSHRRTQGLGKSLAQPHLVPHWHLKPERLFFFCDVALCPWREMSRQCLEYPKCSSVLSQGSSLNDYCLTMLIKLLPVFEKNVKSYSWLCPTAEIPALVNLEWDGVISFHLLSFIFDAIYSGNKNIVNMACDPMTLILMLPFPMQTIQRRAHHKPLVCTKTEHKAQQTVI